MKHDTLLCNAFFLLLICHALMDKEISLTDTESKSAIVSSHNASLYKSFGMFSDSQPEHSHL